MGVLSNTLRLRTWRILKRLVSLFTCFRAMDPARELADFIVAAIASNAALKLLRMNPIQELGQNEFSSMHPASITILQQKEFKSLTPIDAHKTRIITGLKSLHSPR